MKGKVFVIGLGLIGGSLAMAVRHAHPEAVIVGMDLSERIFNYRCYWGSLMILYHLWKREHVKLI